MVGDGADAGSGSGAGSGCEISGEHVEAYAACARRRLIVKGIVTLSLVILAVAVIPVWPQVDFRPSVPKTWDEAKLEDWATPLAGINVRPATISARDYYALPIDNLRT